MPEGTKTRVLMVSLAALCLALLPIWPDKDTASVGLRTVEVRNTGTLLGENSPELGTPAKDPGPVRGRPTSEAMTITVPKLGLRNVAVPTGSRQSELDREGVIRMKGSGLPWQEGSNTFIAGHALGFPTTRVPYAFYDLGEMMPGDEIFVESADGRRYAFRVYDRMTVEPDDYWVTQPVEGKTVISLQTCTPVPTFEDRLIVRGELVS
jgi:sortase A